MNEPDSYLQYTARFPARATTFALVGYGTAERESEGWIVAGQGEQLPPAPPYCGTIGYSVLHGVLDQAGSRSADPQGVAIQGAGPGPGWAFGHGAGILVVRGLSLSLSGGPCPSLLDTGKQPDRVPRRFKREQWS